MRRIIFRCIFIFLLSVATIACFEVAYRIVYRLFPHLLGLDRSTAFDYDDTYRKNGLGVGGYLKENFRGFVKDGYGGKVWWENNSQRFRYTEDVPFEHISNKISVLSLGGSFTAGYRIGQNETFSSLLEKYFNRKKDGREYEVLISCIESPVKGLYYLSKFGIQFKPDVVLLGITLGNNILRFYTGIDPKGLYILNDSNTEIIMSLNRQQDLLNELGRLLIPGQCLTENDVTTGIN